MLISNEPLTEQRDCAAPVVYGFLRVDGQRGPGWRRALLGVLQTYCQGHELALALTFTEYGPACDLRSTAFVGLLDTLVLPTTYGVVVPSRRHLGCDQMRTRRQQLITRTGVRLMVVRASVATSPDLLEPLDLRADGGVEAWGRWHTLAGYGYETSARRPRRTKEFPQ